MCLFVALLRDLSNWDYFSDSAAQLVVGILRAPSTGAAPVVQSCASPVKKQSRFGIKLGARPNFEGRENVQVRQNALPEGLSRKDLGWDDALELTAHNVALCLVHTLVYGSTPRGRIVSSGAPAELSRRFAELIRECNGMQSKLSPSKRVELLLCLESLEAISSGVSSVWSPPLESAFDAMLAAGKTLFSGEGAHVLSLRHMMPPAGMSFSAVAADGVLEMGMAVVCSCSLMPADFELYTKILRIVINLCNSFLPGAELLSKSGYVSTLADQLDAAITSECAVVVPTNDRQITMFRAKATGITLIVPYVASSC